MSTPISAATAAAAASSAQTLFDPHPFYSGERRLIQLQSPLGPLLVAERLHVDEAINQPFELTIAALSSSAGHELTPLIGEPLTVRLNCVDAGGAPAYRPWHGVIVDAAQLDSDGGLARYQLRVRPWLSQLALRSDSFVFQDKTVVEILTEVFQECADAAFRFDAAVGVPQPLRRRSLCTQYNETDLAFVTRLLAEEGLSYHFEHEETSPAGRSGVPAEHARHVMVITAPVSERPDLGPLRFARPDVNGIAEAIDSFADQRRIQPNAVTRAAWDYRQLAGSAAQLDSGLPQGELPRLEDYDGSGAYRYADAAQARRAAELRLAWHELGLQRHRGSGSLGALRAGARFTLIDHPSYGANSTALTYRGQLLAGQAPKSNAFTLLAVTHTAANNLGSEAARLLQRPELQHGTLRSSFEAAPLAAVVVPMHRPRPTAPGPQNALVVGLANEALTTDRDLRVKIQLPWQRGIRPLPGGLPHSTPHDPLGNAPGNEASGTWVRVAQPAAGANWGAVFVPRCGTEVLVSWVEGDIDRPVIVGQMHNGVDAPPWPAGTEVGGNHPGTIAGWHSPTLDQGGLNQWVIDDATGQCRMRLASQSGASPWSELSIGHLISQHPRSAQRGTWLGSGFLAATDGWASVQARGGLLLSSTARPGTYASAVGTQMEVPEALSQLAGARRLGQALSDVAAAQRALPLPSHAEDPQQALAGLQQALDPAKDGHYEHHLKANERQPGDPVERFAQPHLLLDSPSAAAFTTPASIAAFAGLDVSLTTQADLQATAAHTASLVSGQTTSLYTHAGELQAIAASGPFSLRAHTDALSLLADQDITVLSVNGEIRIQASQTIELIGGNSKVSLAGADITFTCPGSFTVKSALHAWPGPGSGSCDLSSLPNGAVEFRNWVEVDWHDTDLVPLKNADYKLTYPDGTVKQGRLDGQGAMHAESVPGGVAKLELIERDPFDVARLAAEKVAPRDWLGALQTSSTPPTSR